MKTFKLIRNYLKQKLKTQVISVTVIKGIVMIETRYLFMVTFPVAKVIDETFTLNDIRDLI